MRTYNATIILAAVAASLTNASTLGEDVLRRAAALAGQNNFHGALELLVGASDEITTGPEAARISHEIGAANEKLGDEPRAISSYWRAIQLADAAGRAADSTSLSVLWNLGTIYLKPGHAGRLNTVLDRYQQLRTVMDNPADGLYTIRFAVLFQSAHRYGEAEALYADGVNLLRSGSAAAELAAGLSNLGALYSSESRHKEAISCIREALEIGRSLPPARLGLIQINLSAAYLASGDVGSAALNLSDAAATMRAGGTSPETRLAFYWTSARVYRKLNRKKDASLYLAMWKSLAQGRESPAMAGAIDVNELRAVQCGH